jgi:hypothetical protein
MAVKWTQQTKMDYVNRDRLSQDAHLDFQGVHQVVSDHEDRITVTEGLFASYLPLAGGTMTGGIVMGDQDITEIGAMRGDSGGYYGASLTDADGLVEGHRNRFYGVNSCQTVATIASTGNFVHAAMPDAVSTTCRWNIEVPRAVTAWADSNTLTWTAHWFQTGTSAGNVLWRASMEDGTVGTALGTSLFNNTIASGGLSTANTVLGDPKSTGSVDWRDVTTVSLAVTRNGGNASDTLAATVYLVGVQLRWNGALTP